MVQTTHQSNRLTRYDEKRGPGTKKGALAKLKNDAGETHQAKGGNS